MFQNLIIYYSRTGTARQVAEAIAVHTGWTVAEVRDKQPRFCAMAARGRFRAEEEIARQPGMTPEPALVLRQQDVLSGDAGNTISEFALAMTSRHSGTEPMLRPYGSLLMKCDAASGMGHVQQPVL